MKTIYSLLLPVLLAISFIATPIYADSFPPAVPADNPPAVMNYVSTDMYTQSDALRTGSILGGVDIYLRGAGLPNDIEKVQVLIDGQDCPLNLGFSSQIQIACTIPPAKKEGKVTIMIAVDGVMATCSTANLCYYVYTSVQTPAFQFVVPSAVNPNSPLKIGAISRVAKTSLQDVILNKLIYCNFDTYGDQALTVDALSFGKCQIDAVQAGYYTADLSTLQQGKSIKVPSASVVADKSYNPYEIVVVPIITKLNSNSGPSGGEQIIITGSGFSSTPKNNEVLFEGWPCMVQTSTLTSIACVLLQPPMNTVAGPRAGHAGVIQRSFGNKNTLTDLKKDTSYINGGGTITRLMSFEIPYNDNANDFSQALEALFYAPVSGNYQFLLSASKAAELYISKTPLSKTGLEKIAEIISATGFRDYFDPGEKNQISAPVQLDAGKYYFLQAIHLASGTEHLSVGVRIPNAKKSAFNPREVIQVQIKASVVRLETVFTMRKTSENFQVLWNSGGTTKTSSTFKYPGSSSTIVAALSQVGITAEVLSSNYLNFDGQVVSDAQAIQIQYRVRFYTSPTISPLPGLANPSNGGFVKATDVQPTALVSGTYDLSVGGTIVTLKHNAEVADIEKAFNTAVGTYFATRVYRYGRCDDGCQYVVYFTGKREDVPEVTLSQSQLTGGSAPIDVVITLLQDANSDDTLFTPIPTDLLRTYETFQQITVRSNGVLAACSGNCKYQPVTIAACTTLTGFTLNGATLELEFSNAADKTLASFTEVTFGGSKLTPISFDKTAQKLQASFPLNPNGTPKIVAGIHLPRVKVTGCGYITIAKEVKPLTIYETVEKLDAFEIAEGFLRFTAEGTGYGFSMCSCDDYDTTVTIGGVECELVSLNNNEIVCDAMMEVTDGPFTVTVNGLTVDVPFKFDRPDITIDLTGDCYIDLIGEGFSDKTVVKLKHEGTTYLEKCRSCVRTDTLIRCATCGLPPGDYTAIMTTVLSKTNSWQASQPFKIVFDVNSVTPKQGSLLGGTVITLKGHGFSETLNKNQISIGNELGGNNIRCNVIEATRTELKCVVAATTKLQGTWGVWAIIGLEFDASCDGDCTFTFTDTATPKITGVDKTAINADDLITFTGSLFSNTAEFRFDGLLADITSVSDTSITVRVPKILAKPSVPFSAYDPAYGYVDIQGTLEFTSDLTFTDYTPKTGSRYGTFITLTGTGFSSAAKVLVGTTACTIQSVTSTQIICKTPTNMANGATGAVTVTQDTYKNIACSGCAAFKASDTYSPTITKVEPTTTAGVYSVKITGTKFVLTDSPVTVTLSSTAIKQPLTIVSTTTTVITASITNPIPGQYTLDIRVGNYAPSVSATLLTAPIAFPQLTPPDAITTSRAGGDDLTLTFDGVTLPSRDLMSVTLAGFPCPITYVGTNYLVCTTPPLVVAAYNKLGQEGVLTGNLLAASANDKVNNAFDGSTATSVTGTSNNCYLGVDVGDGLVAELTQVQYYPKVGLESAKLALSVIEGSTDLTTWDVLYTLTDTIYEGYNVVNFPEGSRPNKYRYYRFRQDKATSRCEVAELIFKGIKMSNIATSSPADSVLVPKATVTINKLTSTTIDANVEYRKDNTPVITGVTPKVGTSAGGTLVTFEGDNFGNSVNKVQVFIDGTECVVQSVQSDTVTCITGALPDISERTARLQGVITLNVREKGDAKVNKGVSFLYAERWSDWRTWGCDGLPIDGDSVHVPIGMNLLVDICVPELVAVVVEGGLIFEDVDNEFNCKYMMIRNGLLRIGTEDEPYESKLIITVTGVREDEQLPIFGNKAIAVYEGTVDIHGTPKAVTDTKLSATVKAGAVDITVDDPTSFEAGDEIVISSTSNDPSQNEKRTIVCKVGKVITLEYPLDYDHLSEVETITFPNGGGSTTVEIKAIVALLTRNIVIQGDETYSEQEKYGVHMMFYDPGTQKTQVRISNTEFRFAGHAGYVDRHPINFQNMANMMGSYVTGCSVHDTYYRGIQVKGTSYLTISKNVMYNTENEGIALPDGSERMNTIEDNVIIGVVSSLYRFNSYFNPAGILITNPLNFVRRNKVGGAVKNGFTLLYSSYGAGASPSKTICPQGEQLGAFEDNSVLSAGSVGLFIDSYYPRTYSCRNYKDATKADPFSANRPIQAVYKNFAAARTIIGFRAWRLGSVILDNFKILDSSTGGIEVRRAQYAPLNSTQVTNGLVVGNVNLNQGKLALKNYWGILVPGNDGFFVTGTKFAHFDTTGSSITACSDCANAWQDTASRVTFTNSLTFSDVAKRVDYTAPYTHIFRDLDGTLTNSNGGGTAVYSLPHLKSVPECTASTLVSGLVCDKTVEVRGINFWNINPTYLREKTMGVLRLKNGEDPAAALKSTVTYTSYRYAKYGYSAPFVMGYPYQVSFDTSLDVDNLLLESSPYSGPWDAPTTIVFNYTEPREDYDVIRKVLLTSDANLANTTTSYSIFDNSQIVGKNFGDFYNDVNEKNMLFSYTGNALGAQVLDAPDVTKAQINAFRCKLNCPPPVDPTKPTNARAWSTTSKWPDSKKPVAGGDVIIPSTDLVTLDEDTPILNTIEINGYLQFGDNLPSIKLRAKKIWVRGKLIAGTDGDPYQNEAIIELVGTRSDTPIVVNYAVDAGTKVLVVTGELFLQGNDAKPMFRLGQNALQGAKQITVAGDCAGWKQNDEILIAASMEGVAESEKVTIKTISTTSGITTITFDTALQYFHYGAANAYSDSVDMRTEVMLLTRNVKVRGTDEDGLGARILVTDEYGAFTKTGVVHVASASLDYCGQGSTDRAGITFEYATTPLSKSTISRSVISNCRGYGVRFQNSKLADLKENIIYNSNQYGIKFHNNNDQIGIYDNVIVNVASGARQPINDLGDYSAGIAMYDETNTKISIQRNIVIGATFGSYLISSPACSGTGANCGQTSFFMKNVAHSGKFGYIAYGDQKSCIAVSDFTAYRMTYGVISYYRINEIRACNLFLSDNVYSLNLASSSNGNRKFTISDSKFVGLAFPDCVDCYSNKATQCTGKSALALNAFTNDTRPDKFQFYRSSRDLVLGSSYNLDRNTFENFEDNLVTGCTGNKILQWSEHATDFIPYLSVGTTTLKNCKNTDPKSWFRPPVWDDHNCGPEEQCTLVLNSVVRDNDGTFIAASNKGTLFAKNEGAANNEATSVDAINGFERDSYKYALLGFKNLDADKSLISLSPIEIASDDGFFSKVNSHRDNNPRQSGDTQKWISIIKPNQLYDLSFPRDMPIKLQFELQGDTTDYAVIRIKYNSNKVVAITNQVTGSPLDPIIVKPGEKAEIKSDAACGAYIFDRENGIITFKVTTEATCRLVVEQTNSLVANIRFDITVDEFFDQGGVAPFIDKVAAILNIPSRRIRIVSVYKGSVGIIFAVDADLQGENSMNTSKTQLEEYGQGLQTAMDAGQLNVYKNATILNYSHQTIYAEAREVIPPAPTESESGVSKIFSENSLTYIIAGVASSLAILAVGVGFYMYKRKMKKSRSVVKIAPETMVTRPENNESALPELTNPATDKRKDFAVAESRKNLAANMGSIDSFGTFDDGPKREATPSNKVGRHAPLESIPEQPKRRMSIEEKIEDLSQ